MRAARQGEIDSDLWEHVNGGGASADWQVLARLLLGMPADLAWRLEQRGAQGRSSEARERLTGRRGTMLATLTQRGMPVLIALLAAFYIIPSAIVLFGAGEFDSDAVRFVYGIVGVAAGVTIMAGLLVNSRSPWLSAGLVVGGAIVMAVLWFWIFFVLVPVTLLVVWFTVARARRLAGERERSPA